jgi:hypothetical protein
LKKSEKRTPPMDTYGTLQEKCVCVCMCVCVCVCVCVCLCVCASYKTKQLGMSIYILHSALYTRVVFFFKVNKLRLTVSLLHFLLKMMKKKSTRSFESHRDGEKIGA